jgi:hypothetical protein
MTVTRVFTGITSSIAVLLALVVLSAQPVAAQSGGIGGRPGHPDPKNERSKSIFVKQLQPGQAADDAVEVINNTTTTKVISVYGVDSVPSSGGAFACAQAADTPRQVGTWITLSQHTVTLEAGKKVTVPFSISVPKGAAVGEQNGCIALQEQKEPTVQGGIGISFRTAIRVAVLVPGTIIKKLDPQSLLVKNEDNKIVLSPQAKNAGNVSLDTQVEASILSVTGGVISSQRSTFPVLRDQLTQWNFEFGKPFWGGFYEAVYKLTYDQSAGSYLGAQSKDLQTIAGPGKWIFIAPQPSAFATELGVLAVLAAGTAYLWRRRKHQNTVATTWQAYTVKNNEQLQDIAKRHHIDWRKLARSNQLKPPYHLQAGQTIKVPVTTKKPQPLRTPRKH